MTLPKTGTCDLSSDEWNELIALKDAIKYDPSTVSPDKMEKFTELFVRSLEGKYDPPPINLNNFKYHKNMSQSNRNTAFDEPIEPCDNTSEPKISDRSKRHHPGTAFEEYCALNPDASECRVYED